MDACCSSGRKNPPSSQKRLHFVVIGGGSAAFAAAIQAHDLGAAVTMINAGLPIGGCCVNVGCVPSKTLIRAAEAHHRATSSNHAFRGIESTSKVTDFQAIIQQKTELVETLRQQKYIDVVKDLEHFKRIDGWASVLDPHTVTVNGQEIHADRMLIATGDDTFVPDVPGLKGSGYLTSDTAFELQTLPKSLIVLGGRYIALECAQMFSRLGSQVTVLQRSDRILPTETPELTEALTSFLVEEGINVQTKIKLLQVSKDSATGLFTVEASLDGQTKSFVAEQLLVATGRIPNTSSMGLEQAGVVLDNKGFIQVDDTLQTHEPTIFAAGNVIGEPAFVYTAAYEGTLAAGNALAASGTREKRDYSALPWVVFTDPQVAGVGLDLRQAQEQGILDAEATTMPLSHVPRALAARDTRGFIQLIRAKSTNKIIGGRILAPEGGELAMEISLAIKFGITVEQLAKSFHPYLTQSEGIKLAAISFGKDINKLSCCAN